MKICNKVKSLLFSFVVVMCFFISSDLSVEAVEVKSGSLTLDATEIDGINFRLNQAGIVVIDLDVQLEDGSYTSYESFSVELRADPWYDLLEKDICTLPSGYPNQFFEYQYYFDKQLSPGGYSYSFNNDSVHDLYIEYTINVYSSFATSFQIAEKNINMMAEKTKLVKINTFPNNAYLLMNNLSSSNKKVAEVYWNREGFWIEAVNEGTCYINVGIKGFNDRIKVVVKNPSTPKLAYTSYKMCKGDTLQNSLKFNKKSVKWSTSNKKVATVNKSGKITAKGIGKATITAKVGKKKYKCKISVVRQQPDFFASLDDYDTRGNYFEAVFHNNSNKPLTIYSSGSKVMHVKYKSYDRNLKFKKGSSVTIKPNKSATVRFYVKGRVTWYDYSRYTLQYKFKFDGKKYTGRIWDEDSVYKNSSWYNSYWDSEAYDYWMWG